MARIHKFSEELWIELCGQISKGRTLIDICKQAPPDYPNEITIYRWLRGEGLPVAWSAEERDAKLLWMRETYETARDEQLEHWADDIVEIANDDSKDVLRVTVADRDGNVREETRVSHANVGRSKLKIETRQWLMERKKKKYQLTTKQEISGPDNTPLLAGIDAPRAETREEWLERREQAFLAQLAKEQG